MAEPVGGLNCCKKTVSTTHYYLGSKAKARSSETKVLRFDSLLGSLVTSGKKNSLKIKKNV
jgi:hypothetical protein